MELLNCNKLTINYGSEDIINDLDLKITLEDRLGVIGPNGSGKSSLIKAIIGDIDPYKGKINYSKDLRIGYLSQLEDHSPNTSITDYILTDLLQIETRLHELEALMAREGENVDQLFNEYNLVSEEFNLFGGYSARERVESLLCSLGMGNDPNQSMDTLSGGERSLVAFAKTLLTDPNLIILDEPGNHLDYLGLAWLESFLTSFRGGVIIVSHNRYLLDKVSTSILEIEKGATKLFKGNYSGFKQDKLRDEVITKREWDSFKRERDSLVKRIKELQSITMNSYNPPPGVVAELASAKKKLEGLKEPVKPVNHGSIKIGFKTDISRSNIALEVNNYSLSFYELLLDSISFTIHCGERVALVGRNGAGKSSLIGRIVDSGSWESSSLRIGPSQMVGYLSQIPLFSQEAITVRDEVRSWGPIPIDETLRHISKFLFAYEDLDKELSVLSGGESNRLQLARLIYQGCNLLILDEPTNHMDIVSREAIFQGLNEFKGTVLVVSHDRYFLDNLVNRVLEIEDRKILSFPGNFSDFFKNKYSTLPRFSGRIGDRTRVIKASADSKLDDGLLKIEFMESQRISIEKDIEDALSRGDSKAGRVLSNKLLKHNRLIDDLYKKLEDNIES